MIHLTVVAGPIYETNQPIPLHADIFPATIRPIPDGVPVDASGIPVVKVRAVITERALTVAWEWVGSVQSLDIPMTPEQTAKAHFRGGTVGPYEVSMAAGCGCGAARLKNWRPFPGHSFTQLPRTELGNDGVPYGVPPPRYSRRYR